MTTRPTTRPTPHLIDAGEVCAMIYAAALMAGALCLLGAIIAARIVGGAQ